MDTCTSVYISQHHNDSGLTQMSMSPAKFGSYDVFRRISAKVAHLERISLPWQINFGILACKHTMLVAQLALLCPERWCLCRQH